MGVKVDVSGADGLKRALRNAGGALEQELSGALEDEAEAVVQDAQSNVRVESGDLRDSISAEVVGMSADVSPRSDASSENAQKHAIKANVNEFGRLRDPGQPYMTPAAENSRTRWPKRAEEAVNRAIQGA